MNKTFDLRKFPFYCLLLFNTCFYLQAQNLGKVAVINPEYKSETLNSTSIEYAGKLFFTAPGSNGIELYFTDGTEGGTSILKDINEGSGNANPSNLIIFKNKLYFTANDGINGVALWVSDGTPEGTMLFKDINPTDESSTNSLVVLKDKFIFVADDGVSGKEIWASDGTPDGTRLVKDITPSLKTGFPSSLNLLQNKVVFLIQSGSSQLWVTDGSSEGTQLVKDFPLNDPQLTFLERIKDSIYFRINSERTVQELWKTDGTTSGTNLIKRYEAYSQIGSHTPGDNKFFFSIDSAATSQLWTSNGTASGTIKIKNISNSKSGQIQELIFWNNKIYFRANDTQGFELWLSDGTSKGTDILADINTTAGQGSNPSLFTVSSNKLFFKATDHPSSYQLWVTDGTTAGTQKLEPKVAVGSVASPLGNTRKLYPYKGDVLLLAEYDTGILELWQVSGSVTAISREVSANYFRIVPNPATNTFEITGSSISEISITSLQGTLMINQQVLENKNVDISTLPSGVYILSAVGQGNKAQPIKLIKK